MKRYLWSAVLLLSSLANFWAAGLSPTVAWFNLFVGALCATCFTIDILMTRHFADFHA